jgi:DNA polymerase-3 subunit beta
MKLLVKKDLLQKAVAASERNVGRNLTLPVLNNILLKTEDNSFKIMSTDLELAISVKIDAQVEKDGSLAINPKTLNGFLNTLEAGDVKLTQHQQKNSLLVEQGSSRSYIKTEPDKDYPLLPKIDKKNFFTINSSDVTQSLNQVINSAATDYLKPELAGVFFNVTKNEIKFVATDSFRLSEKTLKRENTENITKENLIVPSKTAHEIIRNYAGIKEVLFFYAENNQIAVQNEENEKFNIQIISKLIEGDYPDYTQIIPKDYITKSIVFKKEFLQQIRAASLFVTRINDIELKLKNEKIEVYSQNPDVGEFNSSVEAVTTGEEQEVKFNHQYLLDGLNNIEGDEVILKISRTDGPAVLESTKNKDMLYILMPIKK